MGRIAGLVGVLVVVLAGFACSGPAQKSTSESGVGQPVSTVSQEDPAVVAEREGRERAAREATEKKRLEREARE